MLQLLKVRGGVSSNSTVKYRWNIKLEVFERADVGQENWTRFGICSERKMYV